MKHHRMIISGVVGVLALTAVVGIAQGQDEVPRGPKWDAAAKVPGLADAGNRNMNAAEYEAIRKHVAATPLAPAGEDYGPSLHDIGDRSTGHVLVSNPTGARLAALASDRGDVCWSISDDGAPVAMACRTTITEKGTAWLWAVTVNQEGIAHWHVGGVHDSTVTDISVLLASGASQLASTEGGAFVWEQVDPRDEPVAISYKQNGEAHTEKITTRLPERMPV